MIFAYLDRYGSIWTEFQLKPSILDPNKHFFLNYAYWGGGPVALSSGCCQDLRREIEMFASKLKYVQDVQRKLVFARACSVGFFQGFDMA